MLAVDLSVDWGGRPLSELQRLLERRQQLLKETPRDACIATAIDVLKSLRALTNKAKATPKPGVNYSIVDTGWVGGWTSPGSDARKISRFFKGQAKGLKLTAAKYMRRCVKTASRNGREMLNIRPIWLTGAGAFERGRIVHVYRVTPNHASVMNWKQNRHKGCWYIAAYDQTTAEKHAARLMRKYLQKYSGMARYAINHAMRQVHGEPEINVSDIGRNIAKQNIMVKSSGTHDGWEVRVEDTLAYAAYAFKRSDAVDYAMAKAANSITGYLNARVGRFLDEKIPTPFPEIAKHRNKKGVA